MHGNNKPIMYIFLLKKKNLLLSHLCGFSVPQYYCLFFKRNRPVALDYYEILFTREDHKVPFVISLLLQKQNSEFSTALVLETEIIISTKNAKKKEI